MKDYKLVSDDGDTFTVDDGSGKPFRVPKARLAHKTVERIKQHFADGGEVKKQPIDPGDDPLPPTAEEIQRLYDPTGFLTHGGDITQLPPPARAPAATQADADRANATRLPAAPLPPAPDPEMAPPTPVPSTGPGMLSRPPDETPTDPLDISAALAAPIGGSPPPQQQQQLAPMKFAGDDTARQIRRATQQGAAALTDTANARAGGERIQADIQQDAAQKKAAEAQWEQRFVEAANAEQETQFQKWLDPKNDINPHKWWQTRSVPQKISAAIGLALGGFGAAITKTPNFAMQIIQGEVERDLEAQKLNLDRMQNSLTIRARMTKDYLAGRHLAAADDFTAAAAMATAQGTQTQSETERSNAQALVAQLRAAGAEHIQAAAQRSLQMKQEQMSLAISQQQMQAMSVFIKGLSGGGGFPRQVLYVPGFEKYRELAVDLPDGSVALADDTKQADEARDSMATVSRLKSKLGRYMDTLNTGNPETTDRGTAQEQHADLLAEMGHLHLLNRLSTPDLQLFQDQVPDVSRWLSLKSLDRQRLRGVGKSIDDLVWSRNKQLLHLPDSARPGGG